ncbi:DUF4189 domain-containing protein [Mycobacterium colombiense]
MASEELSEPAEMAQTESAEVAQAAADTGQWAKSETEIIENTHPTEAVQFAWSSEDGTVDYDAATSKLGQSRHRTIMRAGAIIAAAIVAGGGVWMWDHLHSRTAPRATSTPVASGPVLDGIYEIASDNQHETVNGVLYPSTDVARYWAFRSLCTPARCVATAAEVSDTNHQVPNYDHDHSVWLWAYGTWKEDPDHNASPCANSPKQASATMVRTLAPQPDGTLKGTEIDVADSDSPCAAGVVIKRPLTAIRIGDTPKGVVADPASAPPDLGLHANQYVAIAVSPGAKQKSGFPGSGQSASYATGIALSECRERTGADDCTVVETNLNGCVSLAIDPNGGFASGKGPDLESARTDARAKLPSSYWTSEGPCSS